MLDGLDILIKRMDTNPDEFIDGHWDYFLEDHPLNSEIFTEEELQAFDSAKEKLREFKIERRRRNFTEQVITRIFETDNRRPIPTPSPFGSAPIKREGFAVSYTGTDGGRK